MRRLAAGLLVLLFLLVGLGGWLLASPAGLRFLVAQLEAQGWVSVAAVEGRLLDRLEVRGAEVRLASLTLTLEHASLDWRPAALLQGRVQVHTLAASGIRLTLHGQDAPSASEPPARWALPLAVQVEQLRLEGLALRQGEQLTPLLERLEARVQLAEGRLLLAPLSVTTPWGALTATGQWGLGLDAPGSLSLQWQIPVAGLSASLVGEGQLSGTLRTLRLDQKLHAPVHARLTGQLEPLAENLPWQATLEALGLEPSALRAGLPALGAWDLALTARGERYAAKIEQLTLEQGPRRLAGVGQLAWDGGLSGELEFGWQQLAWPLTGPAQLESAHGALHWQGRLEDYRLQGEAALAAPGQGAAKIALQGAGSLEHLTLEALKVQTLDGELHAQGALHWAEDLGWQLQLTADRLRPEQLLPGWPGQLAARAQSQGRLQQGQVHGTLEIERLHGILRGYPLEARLSAELAGRQGVIHALTLRSGRSRIEAQGRLGEEALALEVSLDAPALGELWPGASGTVQGQARLTGSWHAPRLEGALRAQHLAWQGWGVERLTLQAQGGLKPELPVQVRLEAEQLRQRGRLRLTSARLSLDGRMAAHEAQLVLTTGQKGAGLTLHTRGGWDGRTLRLRLLEGQALGTPLGDWRTLEAVELVASPQGVNLPRWCWGQGPARLCLAAEYAASKPSLARLTLAHVDLATLALERAPMRLSGQLAGELAVQGGGKQPWVLRAQLAAEQASVHVPGRRRGEWLAVPLEQAYLTTQLGGGAGQLEAQLRHNEANRLELQLALPGLALENFTPQQRLEGVAKLYFREPTLLAALAPELREMRGVLAGQLLLGGTLSEPLLSGGAQLSEASVVLPELGLRVEEGALVVRTEDGSRLRIEGGARLGQGRLHLEGQVALAQLPDWRAELALNGEGLTVLRRPEASVLASPRLTLTLRPGETRISGQVEVPEAQFDLGGELPASARLSADVQILGEAAPARPQALHTRIELVLGDKVRVEGKGFRGRVSGRLTVIDQPALPGPVGQGELMILDGRYKAYGQDLAIEQGRLIFAGTPLDDPALDVRAVRRGILDGTVAGVRLGGRVSQPTLTLFSTPAMDQAEVLAYVLTGRPLRQGSKTDAALMVQAARAAGFAGGDLVAGRIGQAFGLEEAAIESNAGTRELSLVLGRYLTPRLYLRYAQGLESGLNAFILRYELTRQVYLQAQSGVKAGVDVFYSVER